MVLGDAVSKLETSIDQSRYDLSCGGVSLSIG